MVKKDELVLGALIGNPVSQSISDVTHNKIFRSLQIPARYEKLCIKNSVELQNFMIRQIYQYRWVAVTMPYKEKVIPYLDDISESALAIGAVNTVLIQEGKLVGINTDWSGLSKAIHTKCSPKGKKVWVLGAGGGARAAIYAMKKAGAEIYLTNRTKSKGKELANLFNVEYRDDPPSNYDLFIQATSVGMGTLENQSSLSKEQIALGAHFFDMVYNPPITELLKQAKKQNKTIISGLLMFQELSLEQLKRVFSDQIDKNIVFSVIEETSLNFSVSS